MSMSFPRLMLLLSIALFLTANYLFPQPPPPKATGGSRQVPVREDSLKELPQSEKFLSVEGRFTVALPKNISGFGALSPKILGQNASGSFYQWRLSEGFVRITFQEYLDPEFSVTTDRDFVNFFAGVRDAILNNLKGELRSDEQLKLGTTEAISSHLNMRTKK